MFLILFDFSFMNAMEQPTVVTRARARQQRDRILSEIHVPINRWQEEAKQNFFDNYWHALIRLKSEHLQNAELWGHRSITSWVISALCAIGTYHATYTTCKICGGTVTIISCLCALESCDWACYSCKKEAAVRTEIKDIAQKMGWEWREMQ